MKSLKKSQLRDLQFKGEITVFVSLVFLLVLSLAMTLLKSANVQVEKSSMRAHMQLALESVFAEYHRDILDDYDIFVRADCSESVLKKRLHYYGIVDGEHEILKSKLLTDDGGLPFYQSAVHYMKDWAGLSGTMGGEEMDFETDDALEKLERETSADLSDLLSQDENTLLEEDNPLNTIANLKQSNLLSILVSDQETISNKTMETENLPSHRTLKKGVGTFEDEEGAGGTVEKLLFIEYLVNHFSFCSQELEDRKLSYELEYLLSGEESDKENLEEVLKKILWIRVGVNYLYLQTDEVRKAEAAAMAAGLCVLMTVPGITEVVKQALLFAWAYGESVVDLKVLIKGEKAPTVKTNETWQLKLSNLAKLGTEKEVTGEKHFSKGLDYGDYLRGLLLLEDRESLCMRSLDLLESNTSVKTDECMVRVVIRSDYIGEFETEFFYR